jgi:hypothetical protein
MHNQTCNSLHQRFDQKQREKHMSTPENLMSNPSISLNNARTGFVIVADAMITFDY